MYFLLEQIMVKVKPGPLLSEGIKANVCQILPIFCWNISISHLHATKVCMEERR